MSASSESHSGKNLSRTKEIKFWLSRKFIIHHIRGGGVEINWLQSLIIIFLAPLSEALKICPSEVIVGHLNN
jgi:hypothetical protein